MWNQPVCRVLRRAVRNRHRHAIEQVSRRWRGTNALAHQKELQDALDAANKQLKKEGIVIASKDEFIKTLIQTPAAA